MIHIREATAADREDIYELHLAVFSEDEKQKVATLAADLLSEETAPETISLVAEADGAVVGHIAFSPVSIPDNDSWTGYILAPLGVVPAYHKRGIGSKLIQNGLEQLSERGVNVVFVYGDPDYYGRFGFSADAASTFLPPYEIEYPFGWQAIVLNEIIVAGSNIHISCVAALCDPALW